MKQYVRYFSVRVRRDDAQRLTIMAALDRKSSTDEVLLESMGPGAAAEEDLRGLRSRMRSEGP